ncbi:hypothetical protein CF15_08080 [Pyrodictium occultum]|uniref:Uncharacterized protein n=1 Tax=Pyrodictium occultum TaxID=2309 RepID=A0A0V8RRI3_PYROC|nr:hypothetical protein [Pyrodictium occultum]KSW10732.1 hypothetical protein CF15_08080 [Pyrodictium occultum]
MQGGGLSQCIEALAAGCGAALAALEEASEALGKGRGKGGGLARILRRAAGALSGAVEPCIGGCGESGWSGRCVAGEVLERLQRSLYGLSLRLEGLPRLEGEAGELAAMLVDLAYSMVEAVCYAGSRAGG